MGVPVLFARFARSYVDPNRAEDDIDPLLFENGCHPRSAPTEKSRRGVGLIFRLARPGMRIYRRKLTLAEVEARIERCWRPYHRALGDLMDRLTAGHGGKVWHVNWHSMQSVGNELSPDPGCHRPDFVLGDLHGRSCAREFTSFVEERLRELGYSVSVNDPYAGAEILARHGAPERGRQSLQIEIHRTLYMDEATFEPHAGIGKLTEDIAALTTALAGWTRAQRG